MSTRETQDRIISTAVALFNASSASRVSTNRIADEADLSRGNLHYHFHSKRDLLRAIWYRMEEEINAWSGDSGAPTIHHMAEMTLRQYRMIWRYRFFYRELNILLEADPELKYRFNRVRAERMEKVTGFLQRLQANGVMKSNISEQRLRKLVKIAWVLSDFWLSYIAVEEETIGEHTMQEGYELILQLFRPALTERALREIPDSLQVFSAEASQGTPDLNGDTRGEDSANPSDRRDGAAGHGMAIHRS